MGPLTKTFSDKKSEILFESRKWVFRLELLSFSKIENSIAPSSPIKNYAFAWNSRKNIFRPRMENLAWKSKVCGTVCVSLTVCILKGRTYYWSSMAFPFFWASHAEVLSFCGIENGSGLQKVAFPSFWALEAPVVLQSSTCHWSSESGVSIFLGARSSCRSAK